MLKLQDIFLNENYEFIIEEPKDNITVEIQFDWPNFKLKKHGIDMISFLRSFKLHCLEHHGIIKGTIDDFYQLYDFNTMLPNILVILIFDFKEDADRFKQYIGLHYQIMHPIE